MQQRIFSVFSRLAWLACALAALALPPSLARADQRLRVQVNQRGDFLLIGNTLGWDCAMSPGPAPSPVVGTIPSDPANCGVDPNDSSPDVFWRSDAPSTGAAQADSSITPDQARSTAFLDLPNGAEVTHAFLYWGARHAGTAADATVVLERPTVFSQAVAAISSNTLPQAGSPDVVYQSVADVTGLVRANGRGAYRISGVDVNSFPDASEDVLFGGWSLVVFYRLDSEPPRNLAIFDGLDGVDQFTPSAVSLSGFLVPNAGFDAKFGAIVYEGDDVFSGDSLRFGTAPLDDADRLTDALNPVDNFFNGTRSWLGNAVSQAGDLPQLTGGPRTMAGMDLDVVDVTDRMKAGQTSVDLQATSSLDVYFLGAFITSISTFRPDFVGSLKEVKDVNGGVLLAGETLEYTITVINNGNDASAATVVTDPLPTGVTFVPGSIQVTSGMDTSMKTDAAGDDQGEYDATKRQLTVRIGTGATSSAGGSIPVGGKVLVTFQVKVDATTRGVISNQGQIDAKGARGAPSVTTLTDADSSTPGTTPTEIPVAGCQTDAHCGGSTPFCDTTQMPPVCVQCMQDKQCPGPGSMCDLATHTCHCGGVPMSCMDSDGDGLADPDETAHGSDPLDADTDDDGVPDGAEKDALQDSDGDGLINVLDPDSDDDALFDGTESGYDCSNPATNAALGHCRADGDRGATKTDPTDRDSDDGGVIDGSEDSNFNGVVDPGERDPTAGHGADDKTVVDHDGDGLSDAAEDTLHSNPNDRDSDDDGLLDGDERNPSDDTDGDGLVNVRDPDSDDDALYDGTESGKDCSNPDTKPGHCIPDGDHGATTTSPVIQDTDRGGARDGSEDSNRNGVVDNSERDPTVGHGADDTAVTDSDGDGLSDDLENGIGSNPNDADTDDDGVRDGNEANPADDTDGDGAINVVDTDSDADKLPDGTERGTACTDPATDNNKHLCVADSDGGKTHTSMVDPDTDHGGALDGDEDANHNGVVDRGERDPNNPADDNQMPPEDAGVADAGSPPEEPDAGPEDAGFGNDHRLAGGGCGCTVAPTPRMPFGVLLGVAACGLFWARRRRRALRSARSKD